LNSEVSIIIPVYNEEANVLPLAKEIVAAMTTSGRSFELIFVDDCSQDRTWERIQEASRSDRRVHGLRHQRNCGQSAALWTGFQNSAGAIIATLDGDLQNDPADLPMMIDRLNNADFVTGTRAKRADTWLRRVSSRVARGARRAILKHDIHDSGCAARAFRRETLSAAFAFNGLHRFLPILVANAGFRVVQVPVNHRARVAGVSKYGLGNRLGRGIFDLFGVAWFQKRQLRPVGVTRSEENNQSASTPDFASERR